MQAIKNANNQKCKQSKMQTNNQKCKQSKMQTIKNANNQKCSRKLVFDVLWRVYLSFVSSSSHDILIQLNLIMVDR